MFIKFIALIVRIAIQNRFLNHELGVLTSNGRE